jgi:hypothetical protein
MNALNYIQKHKDIANVIMMLDLDLANNNITKKAHNKIQKEIINHFLNLKNYGVK